MSQFRWTAIIAAATVVLLLITVKLAMKELNSDGLAPKESSDGLQIEINSKRNEDDPEQSSSESGTGNGTGLTSGQNSKSEALFEIVEESLKKLKRGESSDEISSQLENALITLKENGTDSLGVMRDNWGQWLAGGEDDLIDLCLGLVTELKATAEEKGGFLILALTQELNSGGAKDSGRIASILQGFREIPITATLVIEVEEFLVRIRGADCKSLLTEFKDRIPKLGSKLKANCNK